MACFPQLYNEYLTRGLRRSPGGTQKHDDAAAIAELGQLLTSQHGGAIRHLGRRYGYYEGDMPHLSTPPTVRHAEGLSAVKEIRRFMRSRHNLLTWPADYRLCIATCRDLRDALGGGLWAELRARQLLVNGPLEDTASANQMIGGYLNLTDEVLSGDHRALLRRFVAAHWLPIEGQHDTIDGPKSPGSMLSNNQMLVAAIPVSAIAVLGEHLKTVPSCSFAVASEWPLWYNIEEWRHREFYITGSSVPPRGSANAAKSPTARLVDLGVSSAFHHSNEFLPGPRSDEYRALYVTVTIVADEPLPDLFEGLARVADELLHVDAAWHAANPVMGTGGMGELIRSLKSGGIRAARADSAPYSDSGATRPGSNKSAPLTTATALDADDWNAWAGNS